MKIAKILVIAAAVSVIVSCKNKSADTGFNVMISPDAGSSYKAGTDVPIKISYSASVKPDSVVYLLDSVHLAVKKDSSVVTLKTDTLKMGIKTITVKVYQGGKDEDAATNIIVLAPKEPEILTYKVEREFPHDTTSYTEGLIYHNGFLYESDGGRVAEGLGQSSLRKTDLNGKVLQKVDIDPKIFAEGIAIVNDKIVQLTYTEKIGYVYDLNTFKLEKTFTNNVGVEGWGMTSDDKKLYMDDSTNRIWFLDKTNYRQIGYIDVYDDKGPINQINELEYIDGKIYANIYTTDTMIVIDPKTGAVLQRADFSTLYPGKNDRNPSADVFNGIAWDAAGKRMFVTGKKWDKLFQVKMSDGK
ncbi:glutaminyl-peptide cyclotransferase [Mucilaginibacter agri]|uniref:Glutaminyl-peptide cyclotransferase n=1 Tax=Mucilaginibacter agri TaxID=2695265 RepID=A0A965ZIA6_9SPHI|nr:glutaminyl-peptide cyclotransferase [Mucilaginibacter agri]NCD70499.1 glutaminyl-peptide cyclotransferase [Mucilaginibacter agri]